MIKGFSPIVAPASKVLILGSMPSITSLIQQEYYAHKQNRFWKVIEIYSQCKLTTYEEKERKLKELHIALWDVLKQCEREGSLDCKIHNPTCNDVVSFCNKYRSIQTILCNGTKSYQLYQKHFSSISVPCILMPSTSSANRKYSEQELISIWINQLASSLKV